DSVNALGDEAADGLDLVFLLLLGVGELEVDAAFLGLLPGHGCLGGAPARFRADLREADDLAGNVLCQGTGRQGGSEACREGKLGYDAHNEILPMAARRIRFRR